jgi:hypothetical protein
MQAQQQPQSQSKQQKGNAVRPGVATQLLLVMQLLLLLLLLLMQPLLVVVGAETQRAMAAKQDSKQDQVLPPPPLLLLLLLLELWQRLMILQTRRPQRCSSCCLGRPQAAVQTGRMLRSKAPSSAQGQTWAGASAATAETAGVLTAKQQTVHQTCSRAARAGYAGAVAAAVLRPAVPTWSPATVQAAVQAAGSPAWRRAQSTC